MNRGNVVFLASVWAPGYGVSVVVREQCRILSAAGWHPVVGAVRVEPGMDPDVEVVRLSYVPFLLRRRLESLAPSIVVACTAPFPRALAGWSVPWIHWDHGRAEQPEGVLRMEASACERVGPSRWLAARFDPPGIAIPNGGDHLGRIAPLPRPEALVRVVAALRGGAAEARYKGNGFLKSLPARTGRSDMLWELFLRGGEPAEFEAAGWTVRRDSDRAEMAFRWREADLHLAPSRIESFDLPLAEAQHLGCAGLALSGGAHDEICRNVFRDEDALAAFLRDVKRDEVDRLRAEAFAHVARFSWKSHGEALLDLVEAHARSWTGPVPRARFARFAQGLAARAYDAARRVAR